MSPDAAANIVPMLFLALGLWLAGSSALIIWIGGDLIETRGHELKGWGMGGIGALGIMAACIAFAHAI